MKGNKVTKVTTENRAYINKKNTGVGYFCSRTRKTHVTLLFLLQKEKSNIFAITEKNRNFAL